MKFEVVCPTKGRAKTIGENTFKLLPNIKYAVLKNEKKEYMDLTGMSENQIIEHDRIGIANLMSFVMEERTEHCIVRIDDDLNAFRSNVGQRPRKYTEEEEILQIMENGAEISNALGTDLFYWNASQNPLHYVPQDPLSCYGGFAAGCYGINGRRLKYDTNLWTREDVDLTMQALKISRFVWSDKRFSLIGSVDWKTEGGNQSVRTNEREQADAEYLQKKWGRYLELFVKGRLHVNTTGIKINLARRNALASI